MEGRIPGTGLSPGKKFSGTGSILFLFAVFILPALTPGFAWMSFLVPAALLLVVTGRTGRWKTVAAAAAAGCAAAAAVGNVAAAVPGIAMLPAGAAMVTAVERRESLIQSALVVFMAMALSSLLFGAAVSISAGSNVYTLILGNIQAGIDASLEMIKGAGELTPEQISSISRTAIEAKKTLPQLLPGILLASLAGATLLNMVVGRWLLGRLRPEAVTWPPFPEWKAPEPLVFGVIGAGFALLTPFSVVVPLAAATLMLLHVVYFYQGLAVLAYLFEFWRTPPGLRLIVFGLLVLQAYGVLFLSLTGLIDVWADFRGRLNRMADRGKNKKEL